MTPLNNRVAFFSKYSDTAKPDNRGTFLQVVKSAKLADEHIGLIQSIRTATTKDERDQLKLKLPAFTPSGIFSKRESAALIQHSSLLSFDLDSKENSFLNATTATDVKRELAKLPEVACCQLSVSGAGVWGVVPILYPDRHGEQFEALAAAFLKMGYTIDKACKDVARLRFWSFDSDTYINPDAETFKMLPVPKPENYTVKYRRNMEGDDAGKVECCLDQIDSRRLDITGTYPSWFSLGCALANEFGENGRDYFHRVSQFHPEYRQAATDKMFSDCMRKRYGYTLGTFFEYCEMAGVKYKDIYKAPRSAPHRTQATQSTTKETIPLHEVAKPTEANAPPDDWQTFATTEDKQFEQRMSPAGYPALFDDPAPIPDAVARNIRQEKIELMETHGFVLAKVEPMTPDDEAAWLRMMGKL